MSHKNVVLVVTRWEARKNEGIRALAMIRRQVIARSQLKGGRRLDGQHDQHRCPAVPGTGRGRDNPTTEASAITVSVPSPDKAGSLAISSVDADALGPPAAILLRAVEAVLTGSQTSFAIGGRGAGGGELDESEGGDAEREGFREILERLGRAHGVLQTALGSLEQRSGNDASCDSGGTTAAPSADSRVSSADNNTGLTARSQQFGDVELGTSGGCGGGDNETEDAGGTIPVEPPSASQWDFQCSPGGSAGPEILSKTEHSQEEDEGKPGTEMGSSLAGLGDGEVKQRSQARYVSTLTKPALLEDGSPLTRRRRRRSERVEDEVNRAVQQIDKVSCTSIMWHS